MCEAVGTGVAAADDHHMLAFGGDVVDRLDTVHATCGVRQELHGEMDTLELAAWNLHVTRHGGADGNHHCVVAGTQVIPGDVLADFHAGAEHGAFGFHLLDSAVDEALVEFEVSECRNASDHPMASSRSYTTTVWPARVSCWAQARPDGPEPTTATVWSVRRCGGRGLT